MRTSRARRGRAPHQAGVRSPADSQGPLSSLAGAAATQWHADGQGPLGSGSTGELREGDRGLGRRRLGGLGAASQHHPALAGCGLSRRLCGLESKTALTRRAAARVCRCRLGSVYRRRRDSNPGHEPVPPALLWWRRGRTRCDPGHGLRVVCGHSLDRRPRGEARGRGRGELNAGSARLTIERGNWLRAAATPVRASGRHARLTARRRLSATPIGARRAWPGRSRTAVGRSGSRCAPRTGRWRWYRRTERLERGPARSRRRAFHRHVAGRRR